MDYIIRDNQNLELIISKRGEEVWILFKDLVGPPDRNEILIVYDNIRGVFRLIASEGRQAVPNEFQSIEELLMNLGLKQDSNIIQRMIGLFHRGIYEWREIYLVKEQQGQQQQQFPTFNTQYSSSGTKQRFNPNRSRKPIPKRSGYPSEGIGQRFNPNRPPKPPSPPPRFPSPASSPTCIRALT